MEPVCCNLASLASASGRSGSGKPHPFPRLAVFWPLQRISQQPVDQDSGIFYGELDSFSWEPRSHSLVTRASLD